MTDFMSLESFTQPVYSKTLINLGTQLRFVWTWPTVDSSLSSLFGVISLAEQKQTSYSVLTECLLSYYIK